MPPLVYPVYPVYSALTVPENLPVPSVPNHPFPNHPFPTIPIMMSCARSARSATAPFKPPYSARSAPPPGSTAADYLAEVSGQGVGCAVCAYCTAVLVGYIYLGGSLLFVERWS